MASHDDPAGWTVGRLLSAVTRRVEHEWNGYLEAWGLTHASLPVLVLLLAGPSAQRDLAAAVGVTEQTMSRIVERLERQGYVARAADPADARRHRVTLTDTGREVVTHAADRTRAEALTSAGLTEDEIASLRTILLRMLDARSPGRDA